MSIDVTATEQTLSRRVAAEVRAEMGRQQVSGRTLAARLGRSPNWVSLKTSGAQRLDLDELATIAAALGVTVIDLFPRRDREVTEPYPPHAVTPAEAPARPVSPRHDGRPARRTDTTGSNRVAGRTRRLTV